MKKVLFALVGVVIFAGASAGMVEAQKPDHVRVNITHAYDSTGNSVWIDNIQNQTFGGNVSSVEELDQQTLTVCNQRGIVSTNRGSKLTVMLISCTGLEVRNDFYIQRGNEVILLLSW